MSLDTTYMLGYLAGVINGISMRSDVPNEVRNVCEEALIKYSKWDYNRWSKAVGEIKNAD